MDILYRTLITPSVDVLEFSVQNRKYRSHLHHRTRIFKTKYMCNVINRIICDFLTDWCYDMLCASMRLIWETPVFICYVQVCVSSERHQCLYVMWLSVWWSESLYVDFHEYVIMRHDLCLHAFSELCSVSMHVWY